MDKQTRSLFRKITKYVMEYHNHAQNECKMAQLRVFYKRYISHEQSYNYLYNLFSEYKQQHPITLNKILYNDDKTHTQINGHYIKIRFTPSIL